MTIITKPISEKKPLEKPLVLNEVPVAECVGVGGRGSVGSRDVEDIEEAWLSPSTRRRVSTTSTVCAFLMALIVISLGVIGGVYIYREFAEHKMSRFQGWCGIPYEESSLKLVKNGRFLDHKEDDNVEWLGDSSKLFKEEFDLDLETDLRSEIFVPDFGNGRQGRFIHDFNAEKTAIVDIQTKRCFVMSLDEKYILPPKMLFDLIRKVWMGYYKVDTEVVRNNMRVVKPPITNVHEKVGNVIGNICKEFDTYNLVPAHQTEIIRKRRSTDDTTENKPITLVEFAGKKIMEYTIYDDIDQE